MTQNDYYLLAAMLRSSLDTIQTPGTYPNNQVTGALSAHICICSDLASRMRMADVAFDREEFMQACGYDGS